jgi:hypothetical protein
MSFLEHQPDDIIRYLCTFLPFVDFIKLYQTAKRFVNIINFADTILMVHLKQRLTKLDIGIDPDTFCNILLKHDAVIAGSFPLQIITGHEWISDIDIFVYTTEIAKDIVDQFGYTSKEQNKVNRSLDITVYGDHNHIIREIHNCVKVDATEDYKPIQVIVLDSKKKNSPTVSEYVNKSFDLDCCKIMFNGSKFKIFEIKNLLKGITSCNVINYPIKGKLTPYLRANNIERISKYYKRGFTVENLEEVLDMAYNHVQYNEIDDIPWLSDSSDEETEVTLRSYLGVTSDEKTEVTPRYDLNITKIAPYLMREPCQPDCKNINHTHRYHRSSQWIDDPWDFIMNEKRKTQILELSPDKKIIALYVGYDDNTNTPIQVSSFVFQRDIPNIKYEKDRQRLQQMLE